MRRIWSVLLWSGIVLAGLCLTGCQKSPKNSTEPVWYGMDLTGALSAESMNSWTLSSTRSDQKRLGLTSFRGKVVAIFFGYTQCPDVCPTTLVKLERVRAKLNKKDADKLQVVFITVDPERDTLENVRYYVKQFDPSFVGLRGTPEETRKVADLFKVFYEKSSVSKNGNYSVNHSGGIFLIDTQGQVRLLASDQLTDDQLHKDIEQLLHLKN